MCDLSVVKNHEELQSYLRTRVKLMFAKSGHQLQLSVITVFEHVVFQ
jgi:hypothetical protein